MSGRDTGGAEINQSRRRRPTDIVSRLDNMRASCVTELALGGVTRSVPAYELPLLQPEPQAKWNPDLSGARENWRTR